VAVSLPSSPELALENTILAERSNGFSFVSLPAAVVSGRDCYEGRPGELAM
jgi:hypothetical protein